MSSRWDPISLYNRRRLLAEPGGERMMPGSLGGVAGVEALAQPRFPAEPAETQRSRPAREEPPPDTDEELTEPDPPMCADCLNAGSRDGTPLVGGRHAA